MREVKPSLEQRLAILDRKYGVRLSEFDQQMKIWVGLRGEWRKLKLSKVWGFGSRVWWYERAWSVFFISTAAVKGFEMPKHIYIMGLSSIKCIYSIMCKKKNWVQYHVKILSNLVLIVFHLCNICYFWFSLL